MAKAKKLPSGNWRARVSYVDTDGKRHFESFTASTKKEAEYMAAEFELDNSRRADVTNLTLGEASDKYIAQKEHTLSPTTIQGYRKIRRTAFQNIMDLPLRKITEEILQNAVYKEMERPQLSREKGKEGTPTTKTQSPKSVRNAYGFIIAVILKYRPGATFRVDLPKSPRRIRTLPDAESVFKAVQGSCVELPCLLAMWLSFSESEIRGLTKSKSIDGDYITIREVVVLVNGQHIRKELAKTDTRIRRHKMPEYIKTLIENVEGDVIVPMHPAVILENFHRLLKKAGLPQITFHDLRHISASVMALLRIPDVYAQERGGWASDSIMKSVYTETFSTERQAVDATIDAYFSRFVKSC